MALRLDRAASLYVAAPIRSRRSRRERSVAILMYHGVRDQVEYGGHPYYGIATSTARFRAQMQWIKHQNLRVLDLHDALDQLHNETSDGTPSLVLTFDDGLRDFHTNARPILDEFGFTATIFLPTAFIGEATRYQFKSQDCMTWAEVRELSESGFQFGSHTATHPVMHQLTWPEIRRELRDSRQAIEDRLQKPVRAFAHPYAFPQEDRGYVRQLSESLAFEGYTVAVTTALGRVTVVSEHRSLRRLPVNEHDDVSLLAAKIAGAYDWLAYPQRAVRQARRLVSSLVP